MQISRDELEKLVSVPPAADATSRELPLYEASPEDGSGDNDAPHPDDATKRISYAALLGGSQAGRGGPSRPPRAPPEVHELPTLIAHQPLTEETARALALASVPSLDDAVELDEPLPSFDEEAEPSFEILEQAAATYASPYGSAPDQPLPAPRRKLDSNPLPVLGFDDSDVTVRAVIEIPPEAELPPITSIDVTVRATESFAAPTEPAGPPLSLGVARLRMPSAPPAAPAALPTAVVPLAQTHVSHGAPPDGTLLPSALLRGAPELRSPPEYRSTPELQAPLHPGVTSLAATSRFAGDDAVGLPGLFAALGQRCSFLGGSVPLAVLWLIPTALAIAALAAVLVLPRGAAENAVPVAPPPPVVPAKPPETPSLRERVIQGEPGAYETLNRKAEGERSVADALALAKGRAHVELEHLGLLKRDIEAGKANVADEGTREKLLAFVTDSRTAPEALALLAALPGPEGPDLLYEIWTGTKRSNDTTQLAHELLYKPEIRKRASESLGVALDLRAEPACEAIPEILSRAKTHADWRSLHLLGKLLVVKGCGSQGYRDCYPCLRMAQHEASIGEAIQAVRQRPRPKP